MGSDLFLCEANILHKDMTEIVPHLYARQAHIFYLKLMWKNYFRKLEKYCPIV